MLLMKVLQIILLKFRLKRLEKQFHLVDNKKIELEKLLSDFQYRHTMELGDLLLEILEIRTQLFQSDKSKYDDAKKFEEQFRQQYLAEKKQDKHLLNNDEKKELKKKFRRATVLCHPDKVDEKYNEEAKEVFIALKSAYDSNDLKKVANILIKLEKGNYFNAKSETFSEKELLIAKIKKLRGRIKSLEKEIRLIKKSYEFKRITAIDNWNEYFSNMKSKLKAELEEMKKQLSSSILKRMRDEQIEYKY